MVPSSSVGNTNAKWGVNSAPSHSRAVLGYVGSQWLTVSVIRSADMDCGRLSLRDVVHATTAVRAQSRKTAVVA